jgi:hypothetical protein
MRRESIIRRAGHITGSPPRDRATSLEAPPGDELGQRSDFPRARALTHNTSGEGGLVSEISEVSEIPLHSFL